MAETIAPISSGLRSSTAPQSAFSTLGTEQPQFRSMIAGPREAIRFTAAPAIAALEVKIWKPVSFSMGAFTSRRSVVPLSRYSASAETISAKQRLAPWRTQTARNAASE